MPRASLTNFNITCTECGYFVSAKGEVWNNPPLSFSQNKFYFLTKGECRMTVGGRTHAVRAGDWVLIPSNTAHSCFKSPEYELEEYWLHFETYPETDMMAKHFALPHLVKTSSESYAPRLFSSFLEIYESETQADIMAKKALLFALLSEYIRLAHPEGAPPLASSGDARLDTVLQYIRRNIAEPLSIASLATVVFMHPNHFVRFFKDKTGITPARYIKMERMRLAKEMLLKTERPIAEIMEKIGQSNPCTFSKQFKSIYSRSPREFRRDFKKLS